MNRFYDVNFNVQDVPDMKSETGAPEGEEKNTTIGQRAWTIVPVIANGISLALKGGEGSKALSKLEKANFLVKGSKKKGAKMLDALRGVMKEGATLLNYDQKKLIQWVRGKKKERVILAKCPKLDTLEFIQKRKFKKEQLSGGASCGIPTVGAALTVAAVTGGAKVTELIAGLLLSLYFAHEVDKALSGSSLAEIEKRDREFKDRREKTTNEIMKMKDPTVEKFDKILKKNGFSTDKMTNYQIVTRGKIIADLQEHSVSKKDVKEKTKKENIKMKDPLVEKYSKILDKSGHSTEKMTDTDIVRQGKIIADTQGDSASQKDGTKGKGETKEKANNKNGKKQNGGNEDKNIIKADDKYLKKNKVDAHQVKKDYLGDKAPIAQYDLYIDKVTGRLFIFRKGGKPPGIPTDIFIK